VIRARLAAQRNEDRKTSILVSVVVHVIVIALIASITFSYPFASLFPDRTAQPERIQYVRVQPKQPVGNGSDSRPPKKVAKLTPAPLVAPIATPTELPPVPAPTVSSGAISGVPGGSGGAPAGVATGVEPALPDPRIELRPNGNARLPLSMGERNDSAVKAIFYAYREAEIAAEANSGRSPRDWTFEKNGQKYGLDSSYLYLGRFKIPSAILAALPLNFGGVDGRRLIENRNADWIRNDIWSHSQGLSEDDFRAAVKRIRERKDKEKKEADEAKARSQPIVP
jgi:hypothetical protein